MDARAWSQIAPVSGICGLFLAAAAAPTVGYEHAANRADARVFDQRCDVVDHRRIAIACFVFQHEEAQARRV